MGAAAQERTGARVTATALLLAGSVLLSRVLGLLRDRVLAHQIGVGPEADAYGAAFLVPDVLNYFLAGGALSIAFIPLYSRVRAESGPPAAAALFGTVLGSMGLLALAATALLLWQAEALVGLAFPRFDPDTRELTARLTRIVLPAQVFFVAGGVIRAVLMAEGRFAGQALAPLLYNLGIIAGGLALGGALGAEGFAWGALFGAFAGPFAVPLWELLRRTAVRARLRFAPLDPDLRRYLALAAPLMLGVTLLTVDEWYEKLFGALQAEGTVASLGYARRLMLVPVAVVGQAIGTAALPALAQLWQEGRRDALDRLMLGSLRAGLGLALLGAAACTVFATPLVALIIQTGRFGPEETARVSALLGLLALAIPGWIVQQIAVRGFYARGQMWLPMLLGSAVALAAIPLYWELGERRGAAGLAWAGVLGISANAALTLALARWRHGGPPLSGLLSTGLRAAAVAIAAAWAAGALLRASALPGPLAQLLLGGGAFAAVGLLGIAALGDAALREPLVRGLSRLRGGR